MAEGPELELGTLVYRGSPTLGSAIVYSSEQKRWVRVPIPEVSSVNHRDSLIHFLVADRVAQSMLMVLMFALVLVGIGSYGFGRIRSEHRASVPAERHLVSGSVEQAASPDLATRPM